MKDQSKDVAKVKKFMPQKIGKYHRFSKKKPFFTFAFETNGISITKLHLYFKFWPIYSKKGSNLTPITNNFSLFNKKNGDQTNSGIIMSNGKPHWKAKKKLGPRIIPKFWHCMIEFLEILLKD